MPLSPEERASLKREIAAEMLKELTAAEAEEEEELEDDESDGHEPDHDVERYDEAPAGETVASGTNAYIPGSAKSVDMTKYSCDDGEEYEPSPSRRRSSPSSERERMARTQCGAEVERYRRKTIQLETELMTANKKIASLERYTRRADRRADLSGMLAQGFEFDLAEELEDVTDMDDSSYAKHLKRIERYARSPVGQSAIPVIAEPKTPASDDDKAIPYEEMSKIVRYASDAKTNGLSNMSPTERFKAVLERYQRGDLKF